MIFFLLLNKILTFIRCSTFTVNNSKSALKIAQIGLQEDQILVYIISRISRIFLAFLALSREKWVIISRIPREIENARNVPV